MIFLDNASTTKIYSEALSEYNRLSNDCYFNASALYLGGVKARQEIENARKNMLNLLGARAKDNVIFCSCATEANNMALAGTLRKKTGKILVSIADHPAVYNMAHSLSEKGYTVEYIALLPNGQVDISDLKSKLDQDVALVSIMHISNETGAVNDIRAISRLIKSVSDKIMFHVDGVQAFGKIPVNVSSLGVDMYTISAHKFHGPKGVGALYVKDGVNLKPLLIGGGQENLKRSGTENVPGICAMSVSASIALTRLKDNYNHVLSLKQALVSTLHNTMENFKIYSDDDCIPYIVSLGFTAVKAETLLHSLEIYDIYIGNGSACSSKKTGNRVLNAMGVDSKDIEYAVRISFGEDNTLDDVKKVCECIKIEVDNYLKILNKGK